MLFEVSAPPRNLKDIQAAICDLMKGGDVRRSRSWHAIDCTRYPIAKATCPADPSSSDVAEPLLECPRCSFSFSVALMPFLPESSAMVRVVHLCDGGFVTVCRTVPNTALDQSLNRVATNRSRLCSSGERNLKAERSIVGPFTQASQHSCQTCLLFFL